MPRCDGVIADKVYDFRLIGIHVFCIFWRDGPSTLKPAFEALHTYLRDHWDEVGPERHRRKVISLGVESLIDNMTSTLTYWQTQGSGYFQSWIDEATREALEETIETLQRLDELPEEHLSPDVVGVQLPKLTQILRGIQKSLLRATRQLNPWTTTKPKQVRQKPLSQRRIQTVAQHRPPALYLPPCVEKCRRSLRCC